MRELATSSPRGSAIADAAARLFRKNGYANTTIREIAAALGIKSASLYHYYENKEDILFTISMSLNGRFVETVTPVLDAPGEPVEAIKEATGAHLRFDIGNLDQALVSSRERRSLPEQRQRPINELRRKHRAAICRVIERGIAEGKLNTDDPMRAAVATLDLLNGVKEWYHPPRDGSVEDLISGYEYLVGSMLSVRR